MNAIVNPQRQLITSNDMGQFALGTLGARIKKARQWAGLGQDKMAELTDVSAVQVSRWENDKSSPTIPRLEQIAQATGQPLYWFFLGPTGIRMDYDEHRRETLLSATRALDEQLYEDRQRELRGETWSPPPEQPEEDEIPFAAMERSAEEHEARENEQLEMLVRRHLEDFDDVLTAKIEDRIRGYVQEWVMGQPFDIPDNVSPIRKKDAGELKHPLAADQGASKGDRKKAEQRARKLLEEE